MAIINSNTHGMDHVPVLVIQGTNDQYGTILQVKAIQDGCQAPVRTVLIEDCGHSPHIDQPKLTMDAILRFLREEVADPGDFST